MLASIALGLGIAAAVVAVALYWFNRRRRKAAKLLAVLSKLGTRHDLSFDSQERLAGGMMGFDNRKKVMLVLQGTHTHYHWYLVCLEDVRSCSVQTTGCGEWIDKVSLHFQFRNGDPPAGLAFYCRSYHQPHELPSLQARARSWQCFLLKLLPGEQRSRA